MTESFASFRVGSLLLSIVLTAITFFCSSESLALGGGSCELVFQGLGSVRSSPELQTRAAALKIEFNHLLEAPMAILEEEQFKRIEIFHQILAKRANVAGIANLGIPQVDRSTLSAIRSWQEGSDANTSVESLKAILNNDPYFVWLQRELEIEPKRLQGNGIERQPFFAEGGLDSPAHVLKFHLTSQEDSIHRLPADLAVLRVILSFDSALSDGDKAVAYGVLLGGLFKFSQKRVVETARANDQAWLLLADGFFANAFSRLAQSVREGKRADRSLPTFLPAFHKLSEEIRARYGRYVTLDVFLKLFTKRYDSDLLGAVKGNPFQIQLLKANLEMDPATPDADVVLMAKIFSSDPKTILYHDFLLRMGFATETNALIKSRFELFYSLRSIQTFYSAALHGHLETHYAHALGSDRPTY